VFSGEFGFLQRHPNPDSLSFLSCFSDLWLVGPLRWPVGLLQLRVAPLAYTSSYANGPWAVVGCHDGSGYKKFENH